MNIPSVFELNSIKDQISLLSALTSHINWDQELNTHDYETLLKKMENTIVNLNRKRDELEEILNK